MSKNKDYYVYVYSHPDTRQPFYVGKGRGGRVRAHLDFEVPERKKQEIIDELRKQGREPIIEIMQWNLSEEAAFAAEAALIQLIGLDQLANEQSGRGTPGSDCRRRWIWRCRLRRRNYVLNCTMQYVVICMWRGNVWKFVGEYWCCYTDM